MGIERLAIVAIGRNEGERLRLCLESLRGLAGITVYVDSGSTDGSQALATSLGVRVAALDISTPFTAARARNTGFREALTAGAKPDFVQFMDGDCVLQRGWLELALDYLEKHPDVAAVCGRRRERHPESSFYNLICDQEWNTPVGEAAHFGGDVLIRTAALQAVGGYRDDMICGEEPELAIRLRHSGWKIWRLDAEMTLHDINIRRFSQWWKRSVRGGYAYAKVTHLHWNSPYAIWKRELARALFFGAILPVSVLAFSGFTPWALALLAIYPLQIIRVALRSSSPRACLYSGLILLTKFAECQGIIRYYREFLLGKKAKLIEYK